MANEFKIRKGLIVEGATGGTVVDIQGSLGQLFSVTDNLSGEIFAVADISGVPIMSINSSSATVFTGLVSGITPTAAANFVTKAYVDGGGGAGSGFLPLSAGPSYPLTNSLYISSSGANGLILKQDTSAGSNSGRLFFQTDTATEGVCIMNVNGRLDFRTSSDPINTSGNTKMVLTNAGSVGIGLTSPSAPLSLAKPSLTTTGTGEGGLRVHRPNALSQYGYFDYGFGGGGVNIGSLYTGGGAASFGTFTFRQHSSTTSQIPMFINNTGNVGIGTTSPTEKLDISGTAIVRSTLFTVGNVHGFNPSFGASFFINNSGGTSYFNATGGNVGIGTTTPNAKLDIQGTQGQLFSVTDDLSGEIFAVADISGVPIMTVNSSGVSYFDGNVGIGTTSPFTNLEIEGSGLDSIIRLYTATGAANIRTWEMRAVGVAGEGLLFRQVNDANTVYTNRMILDNSGNVGIGTISPDAILETSKEVDGNQVGALLTNTRQAGTADSVSLNFGLGRTADGFIRSVDAIKLLKEQQWTGTPSTVDASLVFSTVQNETVAEKMRITAAGNVGIGNTAPTYKLVIGGNGGLSDSIKIGTYEVAKDTRQYIGYARFDTGVFETASGGNTPSTVLPGVSGIRIVNTAGSVLSTKADQSIQLLTHIYNGNSRIALHADANGNIGIGTVIPTTFLQVSGQGNRAGGNIQMGLSSQGANKWSYLTGTHYNSTTEPEGFALIGGYSNINENRVVIGGDIYETNPATSINFWTHSSSTHVQGGSQRMIINSSGNVGIGTTSPTNDGSTATTLEVRGKSGTGGGVVRVSNAGNTASARFFAGSASATIATVTNHDLNISTNNSLKMVVKAGGNVGIGVTNPGNKLRVEGSVRINDSGDGQLFFGTGSLNKIELDGTDMKLWSGGLVPTITMSNQGLIKLGSYGLTGGTGTPNNLLGVDSSGNVVKTSSFNIELDDTPASGTASGNIVNWSVSVPLTAGTLYVVKSDGGWTTADADSEAKSIGLLAIALGSNATQGMLLQGFFYKASHGFAIGSPLYISNTAGAFSTTRPTGINDYVRIIGYATSTNHIYFDPDKTFIKLSS